MQGHWSGNTRKLNKHYQSGNSRFDEYISFYYSDSVRFVMDRKKGLYVCINYCNYRKDTFTYVDDYIPVFIIPESMMNFGLISFNTLSLAESGFYCGNIDARVQVETIDVYDNWDHKITKDCLVISVHKDQFVEREADYSDINLKNNIKTPLDSENYFSIRFFDLGYLEDETVIWNLLYEDIQSYGAIDDGPSAFLSMGTVQFLQGSGPMNIVSYASTTGPIMHLGGSNIHIPKYKNSQPNSVQFHGNVEFAYRRVSKLVSGYFETVYRPSQVNGGLDNRCFDLRDLSFRSNVDKILTNYTESW